MFTERAALQNRLLSLDEKERVLMKEISKERNEIYDRLRELDYRSSFAPVDQPLGEPVSLGELQQSEEPEEAPAKPVEEENVPQEVAEEVKEPVVKKEVEKEEKKEDKLSALTTADAKDYIINILKDAKAPINIKQIRDKLNEEHDVEVNKLSNVMWYLSRKTKFVNNPSRGLYEYNKYSNYENEEVQGNIQ
jgi:hypothetical protein